MKKILILACLFLIACNSQGQEISPLFPGCKEADKPENCSEGKILEFIYAHLNYPTISFDGKSTSKTIVINFIVDTIGFIHDPKIVYMKDISPEFGKEALRAIQLMIKETTPWTPAISFNGKPTDFLVRLPIKFRVN